MDKHLRIGSPVIYMPQLLSVLAALMGLLAAEPRLLGLLASKSAISPMVTCLEPAAMRALTASRQQPADATTPTPADQAASALATPPPPSSPATTSSSPAPPPHAPGAQAPSGPGGEGGGTPGRGVAGAGSSQASGGPGNTPGAPPTRKWKDGVRRSMATDIDMGTWAPASVAPSLPPAATSSSEASELETLSEAAAVELALRGTDLLLKLSQHGACLEAMVDEWAVQLMFWLLHDPPPLECLQLLLQLLRAVSGEMMRQGVCVGGGSC